MGFLPAVGSFVAPVRSASLRESLVPRLSRHGAIRHFGNGACSRRLPGSSVEPGLDPGLLVRLHRHRGGLRHRDSKQSAGKPESPQHNPHRNSHVPLRSNLGLVDECRREVRSEDLKAEAWRKGARRLQVSAWRKRTRPPDPIKRPFRQ